MPNHCPVAVLDNVSTFFSQGQEKWVVSDDPSAFKGADIPLSGVPISRPFHPSTLIKINNMELKDIYEILDQWKLPYPGYIGSSLYSLNSSTFSKLNGALLLIICSSF